MVPHKKKPTRKQAAAQSKRKPVGRGGGKQLRLNKRSSAEITPPSTGRRDPAIAEKPAEHLIGIRLSGSKAALERLLARLR